MFMATSAEAQNLPSSCSEREYVGEFKAGVEIMKPLGFTIVAIASTPAGTVLVSADKVQVLGDTWTEGQVRLVTDARSSNPNAGLLWSSSDGKTCLQRIGRGPEIGTPSVSRGVLGREFDSADQCSEAGRLYHQEVTANDPRGKHTILVFRDELGLCYQNTQRPAQGAMIHVAVFTDNPTAWDGVRVQYQPCSLQPNTPAILSTGTLSDIPSTRTAAKWFLRAYMSRQCWNETVAITIQGGQRTIAHSLSQH
jgi:hypothetical protein